MTTKQSVIEIANNPKVATVIASSTLFQTWWVEWGNWMFDAAATIGGVILVFIMIFLQFQNYIKVTRENREYKEDRRNRLRRESDRKAAESEE